MNDKSIITTYPEMNETIVGLLRMMRDPNEPSDQVALYAAQRIEELESENALITLAYRIATENMQYMIPSTGDGDAIREKYLASAKRELAAEQYLKQAAERKGSAQDD